MAIKTLVEVRGGRVSIVEDGNETQVTITRDGQDIYQAAVDAERELKAAQDQIENMKAELEAANRDRATYQEVAVKAEAELKRRTKERDNRERARARLERNVAQSDDLVNKIRQLVWDASLNTALKMRPTPEAVPVDVVGDLLTTISVIRATVGQP